MDIIDECYDLYEDGKMMVCFQKLLGLFSQSLNNSLRAYWLMYKLLIEKSSLSLAVIKAARRCFLQRFQQQRGGEMMIKENFNNEETRIYVELSIALLHKMLDQSNQIDEIKVIISELQEIVKILESDSITWLLDGINQLVVDQIEIRKNQQDNHKKQVQEYNQLLEEQEELQYFKQEGMFAYLVPTSWFKKWQRYVQYSNEGYGDQVKQQEEMDNSGVIFDIFNEIDQSSIERLQEIFGLEAQSTQIIEEESEDTQYPGPINSSQFIDLQWNMIIDQFSPKNHQNYILRSDIVEGKDFVFMGNRIFKYFKNLYGAFEIKRMVIQHIQTKKSYVDMKTKVINFILCPNLKGFVSNQVYQAQIGSKENFEALNKKILRVLKKKLQCDDKMIFQQRWLKFNTFDDQDEFIQKLQGNQVQLGGLKLNAQIIKEDRMPVEEMDVGDSDILILEFKNDSKRWTIQLESRVQTQQILQTNGQNKKNSQAIAKLINDFNITETPRLTPESRQGLTGLQNLGNTCFMNSALQCLSNIYELTEQMVSNQFVADLNPQNPIGTKGYLAVAYAEMMKQIWFGKQSSVSAWDLKRVIGKFAPQFYGYGQQDSQELLSYVLDGLHEDLNRIINKPVVEDIKITTQSDDEAAELFWQNFKKRNDSIVVDLVAGQFKSTLICPQCQAISRTFDPFMNVSLPIPNYTQIQIQLYLIYSDSTLVPLKYSLMLSSEQTTQDILEFLAKSINTNTYQLDPLMIKDHRIKERVQLSNTIKWIHEHEGILFVHQLNRKSDKLQYDESNVLINFMQKGQKILEFEPKILSYVRQIVVDRNLTIGELYLNIYKFVRPNILIYLTNTDQKLITQEQVKWFTDYQQQLTKERLLSEIDKLQQLCKFPYVFKLSDQLGKNKPQEYNISDNTPLQSISQYIKVDLFINDIIRPEYLKLQRCKQFQNVEQNQDQLNAKKGEYSIQDCLKSFTREEILGKGDEWYCAKCKDHVQATKKMEIYRAPKILIIHLKRFKTNRIQNYGKYYFTGGSQKISSLVNYPITGFDINNYVLSKQNSSNINYAYDLFAVSNHFGGLGNGHYTAYAFSKLKNQWFQYNDSNVKIASTNDIISEAGYILFYRRRDVDESKNK